MAKKTVGAVSPNGVAEDGTVTTPATETPTGPVASKVPELRTNDEYTLVGILKDNENMQVTDMNKAFGDPLKSMGIAAKLAAKARGMDHDAGRSLRPL